MQENVLEKKSEEKDCPLNGEFCVLASDGCSPDVLEDGCVPKFVAGSTSDVVSRRLLMAGISSKTSVRITKILPI